MDRQALLEEKRQRLQQLKQRRAEASANVASSTALDQISPHDPLPPVRSTSIAIQTDPLVIPVLSYEPPLSRIAKKETIALDKAIQVTPPDTSKLLRVVPLEEAPENDVAEDLQIDTAVNEVAVNAFLKESIKELSAIYHGRRDYSIPLAPTNNIGQDHPRGFLSESGHGAENGRPVNALDSSVHFPELTVVAYGEPRHSKEVADTTPGLAIVYNTSTNPIFSEYFLHAISEITCIVFDRSISNRVYAGLKNGQLVMYDFSQRTSTKTGLLPSLSSPMYSLTRTKPSRSYKYHSRAITLLLQVSVEGNHLIVLSSGDGIINVWSPDLLAHPRLDLLQLYDPTELLELAATKRPLPIRKIIVHENANDTINVVTRSTSASFLDAIFVASNNMRLLQLSSDQKHSYFDWKLTCNIIDVILVPLLLKANCIVAANLDWSLLIYMLHRNPIIVPTRSLVLCAAVRPHHHKQFVTLGTSSVASQLDLVIEFWDLGSRLFSAILNVPVGRIGSNATTISFDAAGVNIVVGFADGYVQVWSIDQHMLSGHQPLGIEIDKGIDVYLQKRGSGQSL